jgi:peroxiredoxin
MKKNTALFASVLAAGFGLAAIGLSSSAMAFQDKQDKQAKKDEKKAEKKAEGKAKIGETAPTFKLTDTDGKTVDLAEVGKDKIVVIEWFNPTCPVNKTFATLNKDYASKGVVFLAVNSGGPGKEGHGKELNAKMKKEWKIEYPVLLDEAGTVGKAYGATSTPDVFIIGKDGKLAYAGAVDNNSDAKKAGDKNYAKMALDELLAGKPVTTTESKRYGCGVKYAK